jgi:hypothetical protein
MLVLSLFVVWVFMTLQRNHAQAAQLAACGGVALVGAMALAIRRFGPAVYERFASLSGGKGEGVGGYYYRMRGGYVLHALETVLPENPLGYGLGWWGQVNALFGNPYRRSPVWVEVMIPAWVYDGGAPLLVLYCGAIAAALVHTARVALHSPDRSVRSWAAVVFALGVSIAASCLSFVTFLSPLGVSFWLLTALVHAADAQARAGAGQGGAAGRPAPRGRPRPGPRPRPVPTPTPMPATRPGPGAPGG